jgi:23S rRNA pseudouridine1911/1915/1917 synthase
VIAKTEVAMSHLAKQFEAKHPKGSMWRLWGNVVAESGTIEGNVASRKDRMQMAVLLTLR